MRNIGMFIEKSINRSSDKCSQLEPCAMKFPRVGLFFLILSNQEQRICEKFDMMVMGSWRGLALAPPGSEKDQTLFLSESPSSAFKKSHVKTLTFSLKMRQR